MISHLLHEAVPSVSQDDAGAIQWTPAGLRRAALALDGARVLVHRGYRHPPEGSRAVGRVVGTIKVRTATGARGLAIVGEVRPGRRLSRRIRRALDGKDLGLSIVGKVHTRRAKGHLGPVRRAVGLLPDVEVHLVRGAWVDTTLRANPHLLAALVGGWSLEEFMEQSRLAGTSPSRNL